MNDIVRTSLAVALAVGARAQDPPAAGPDADAKSAPTATRVPFDLDPFALALFAKAAPAGNACLSPFSVAMALAQLRVGARGDTAAQIDALLHAAGDDPAAQVAEVAHAIQPHRVRAAQGPPQDAYALAVANAAFVAQGIPLRPEFAATTKRWFDVEPRALDFAASLAAVKVINDWVAAQTKDRIRDLLAPDAVSAQTQFVLVSCVHLLAQWLTPFAEGATAPAPFHLDATTTVDVPTMHRTGTAGYAQFDDAEVVQLPTRDPDLGLLVVVPRGDSTLADLEAHLPQLWPTLRAPKSARVQLALPRFQVETALSLRAPLIALGMRDAFARGRADLTGIVGRKDTCVDEVVHKTYLKVYEQGIEAAAATAIVSRGAAPGRPQVVTIDRPFLFALVHAKAGALFLGRLVDPR